MWRDRKSTRLNSSHITISYAVFCLKNRRSSAYSYSLSLHDALPIYYVLRMRGLTHSYTPSPATRVGNQRRSNRFLVMRAVTFVWTEPLDNVDDSSRGLRQ